VGSNGERGSNGNGRPLVAVIGPDRLFLYYVSNGRARILLRDHEARVFAHSPLCTIRLKPGSAGAPPHDRYYFRRVDEPVRVLDKDGVFTTVFVAAKATSFLREGRVRLVTYEPPTVRLVRIGREQVERRPQVMNGKQYLDKNGDILNWTEFWREERDIYVQNMHPSNFVIQFVLPGGASTSVSIPASPDPINLTAMVSFQDLKSSVDVRKAFNARDKQTGQRYLRIMEEDEYRAYFDQRAKAMHITADEALRRSEEARRAFRETVESGPAPQPIHRVVESGSGPAGATRYGERQRVEANLFVNEEDVIRDRVRILMYNVQQDIQDEQKRSSGDGVAFDSNNIRPASQILMDLQSLGRLSEDELEHVRAKSYWPSVKRWATTEIQKLQEVPGPEEAPVAQDDGDDFIRRQAMVE